MQVTFSAAALAKTGALIVPFVEGARAGESFKSVDTAMDGGLARAVKAAQFKGDVGEILKIVAPVGMPNGHIIVVGVGKVRSISTLDVQKIGGAACGAALATGEASAVFALADLSTSKLDADAFAAQVAFGVQLRSYRFDKYRTTQKETEKPSLKKFVVNTSAKGAKKSYESLSKLADGVFLTRDLVSEPANILHPEEFAERCSALSALGLKIKVLGEAEMKKLGMGSLLGVGQGSVRESKLVVMQWAGGKKDDPYVAFVGKGVTFDTGGISLKPAGGMEDMKWDMGGAGAVTGAMAAIAGRKAKANVVGVVGLVENMPDGNAQRPGDIVTSMSGQTIEVLNTDAEGRLVLADALWYTQEKFSPEVVIDLATLTGAIIVSLAHEFAGCFTTDDKLAASLLKSAEATGDKLWRMPLTKTHDEMIKSDIADMQNIGGKGAGSSTAAAFLGRFIKEETRWAHLDIAGMAWTTKPNATTPKGGTGYGVQLLDNFVAENYEK